MGEPRDTIQDYIFQANTFYEVPLLERVAALLPEDARIVDVGANIGNHSVYFSRICQARNIWVLEPNPEVIPELLANLSQNKCRNVDVSFLGVALGAVSGTASLVMTPSDQYINNRGGTMVCQAEGGPIAVMRLDDLNLPEADFIKIDVEGMALQVLDGAQKFISKYRPQMLAEISLAEMPGIFQWASQNAYEPIFCHADYVGLTNILFRPNIRRLFNGFRKFRSPFKR